jgi:Flp pilus assembly protein TadG
MLAALSRMKRWLLHEEEEPRRAPRSAQPEVIVHYWDGSAPEGRHLRDISESGAYIYTPERWYLGTIVRIILQGYKTATREDGSTAPSASICVPARVIRHGSDGVAVEFVFRSEEEERAFRLFLAEIPAQPARAVPPQAMSRKEGQALIEFALIVPLVFVLAVNAVNFGAFIYAWITVAEAARAGAQYMTSLGPITSATLATVQSQVQTLVSCDATSLPVTPALSGCGYTPPAPPATPNPPAVSVAICTNNNGTMTPASCTTLSDPEPTKYTLATVDVRYTYNPLIPLFSFPGLNIRATLPPTAMHRQAVMRMLQ